MIRNIRRWLVIFFVSVLGLAPLISASPKQQNSEPSLMAALDDLALLFAQAIKTDTKNPATVLVLDFAEDAPSQLGVEMSDRISGLLAGHGVSVISRSGLPEEFARDKIPAAELKNHQAMTCYAMEAGADIVVEGDIYVSSQTVAFDADVRRIKDRQVLFEDKSDVVTISPEIRAMLSTPRTFSTISESDYASHTNLPKGTGNGYSSPKCAYCPQPQFPDSAVKAQADGSISLALEIDASGTPTKVSVLAGAPCGLNEKAIGAIRNWRLTPAVAPNGKPAAVWIPAETAFHLN